MLPYRFFGKDGYMKVVIGIDVGGSTTKIVGFDEKMCLIAPMCVKANDPVTSVYGAFGKFLDTNKLELEDIKAVMITGVGSSYITKAIYGLPCYHVLEFESVALGGLYLSGLEKAVIVSMGTGTAITLGGIDMTTHMHTYKYLGGTGVGGGTLLGLAKNMLGVSGIESIEELAKDGDIEKIDLQIKDITKKDILPGLPKKMTAANFGKVDDLATKGDIAIGLINLVFETAGMMSVFAARGHGVYDIVLTGNLTRMPQAREIFDSLNTMFDVNFIIPENSQYGTVIGAALLYGKENERNS